MWVYMWHIDAVFYQNAAWRSVDLGNRADMIDEHTRALCHFFMHYDDEVYKEGFVRLLSGYYAGKLREDSLVEYINVPGDSNPEKFQKLQGQFREYMSKRGETPETTAAAGN